MFNPSKSFIFAEIFHIYIMASAVKYAIITGAASGMGRCYATQLAEMGYGVLLVDINGDATQQLSLQLNRQYGVPAPVLCVDLCKNDVAQEILTFCQDNNWMVEVLINNAGMLITSTVEETDPLKLQRIIALHCTTPLLLCRHFIPLMKAQGRGYILNVSSISAWMDWPVIGMYGCTKRFVKGYSHELCLECHDTPVSITTAILGAVDTPLLQNLTFVRFRKFLYTFGIMITPEKATRLALQAMFRRKPTLIPGLINRFIIIICPLVPSCFLCFLLKRIKIV